MTVLSAKDGPAYSSKTQGVHVLDLLFLTSLFVISKLKSFSVQVVCQKQKMLEAKKKYCISYLYNLLCPEKWGEVQTILCLPQLSKVALLTSLLSFYIVCFFVSLLKGILCEDNKILWISKLCSFECVSVRCCFIELV